MKKSIILIIDIFFIACCIIGFYQVYHKAGLPVHFANNTLIVETTNYSSINSGLKINDKILSVDQIKIITPEDLEFILDSKSIDNFVSLTIERDGSNISVLERLVHFYSLRYLVLQILVTLVFIFLALFVYLKRMNDPAAQVFNWAMIFAALLMATTWGKFTIEPFGLGQFIRIVFNMAYAFAAVIFIQFTLVFPYKKLNHQSKLLRSIYLIAFLFFVLMEYGFLKASLTVNLTWFRYYNFIFDLNRIFFTICIGIGLYNFIHSYINAQEEFERRKLRWILLGFLTGPLCFVLFWVIPQVFTSHGLIAEEYVLVTMLSVPITFSISIIKYHILNIDMIFKRSTVYGLTLIFVLIIFIGVVTGTSLIFGQLTIGSSISASAISAAIIAAVFQPLRSWSQNFVDKKFFNIKYNFRQVEKDFSEKIKISCDHNSIMKIIFNALENTIPTEKIELLFFDSRHDSNKFVSSLISALNNTSLPISTKENVETGSKFEPDDSKILESNEFVIAFKISSKSGGLLGALLFGKKKSGFKYNLEDIDLLESICQRTAIALDRITLQKKLISEQNEIQRLKELNELKSYFVSSVTHELKTPLTSISMFAELIGKKQNNKKNIAEYTNIIRGESLRLARLIDNVLNISKIEKGIKEYHFAITDLNKVVSKSISIMSYQLEINEFKYSIDLYKSSLIINADSDAIEEAIINLISNSIKYSKEKRFIKIKSYRKNGLGAVSIKDFGVGISKDNVKKIFKPFERVGTKEEQKVTGTGLGLAIVKHIIDAHKGNIKVNSVPNKGSEFIISFPLTTKS